MTKTRKELIESIAFDRAVFEAECEAKNETPVPFDRREVFSDLVTKLHRTTFDAREDAVREANRVCSTRFVNETTARRDFWRRNYSNEELTTS